MDQAGRPGGSDGPPAQRNGSAAPASSLTATAGERTADPGTPGGGRAASRNRVAGRVPGWMLSAVTRHLVILAGYIGAGIVLTWPRATYLCGHKLPVHPGRGRVSSGASGGSPGQVVHLSNPWFTHYLAAPVGAQLGFHTLMPLPGLVMTPVTLAFGPTVSYNLLSVLMPGLLAYAMYRWRGSGCPRRRRGRRRRLLRPVLHACLPELVPGQPGAGRAVHPAGAGGGGTAAPAARLAAGGRPRRDPGRVAC